MTVTIINFKASATRGPGLHLVPSQMTERHQAIEVPSVWDKPIRWYSKSKWAWIAICVIASAFLGASIVAVTMGWRVK